jgi:hypothetical protein
VPPVTIALLLANLAHGAPARFTPAPPAAGALSVAPTLERAGEAQPLLFRELIHVGDMPGDSSLPWGTLVDDHGRPGIDPNRSPYTDICNEADYNAVLDGPAGLQLVTHFECTRGAYYRSSLVVQDGVPALAQTRYDGVLDPIGGVLNPCAGQVTPWGSLLSSEEYEPEAKGWDPATGRPPFEHRGRMVDDWATAGLSLAFDDLRDTSPYRYGWIPELTATGPAGALEGTKHYAMGRFSHEQALVLPDQRTVYLSDDGSEGMGWFLFVADAPGDLSAGTLYAARWRRDSDHSGPLQWVNLGHATDAELAPWVEGPEPVQFTDLFQLGEIPRGGNCGTLDCSQGTERIERNERLEECLALQPDSPAVPDVALLASRLETRRYAAMKGATLNLHKGEGVAWDPHRQRVYLAQSVIGGSGIEPPDPNELGPPVSNRCGAVFQGAVAPGQLDTDGQPIPSDLVMTELEPALVGRELDRERCAEDGIANPDNIVFDATLDVLFVAEDTRRHDHALLWAWRPDDPAPTPILRAPQGAEVTGIHISQPLGARPLQGIPGARWLFVSIQHPAGAPGGQPFDTTQRGTAHGELPGDGRSFVGVLGPL